MQLDGSSLAPREVYELPRCPIPVRVQSWFKKWWERASEQVWSGRNPRDAAQQTPLSLPLSSHVTAATQLDRVFELLEHVLEFGGKPLATRTSPCASSHDREQTTPPVPQELEVAPQIVFRVMLLGPIRELNPVIRNDIYRIGRAAIENAFHHSGASLIEVEVEFGAHRFRMVVRDNGRGIDQRQLRPWREGHRGLSRMAALAGKIGATLTLWSGNSRGTELELSIPNQIALEL